MNGFLGFEVGEPVVVTGVGEAPDVANVVLFLLSPAAGFVNGESVVVDGGACLVPASAAQVSR